MFDSLLKDLRYQIQVGGFWMRIILIQVVVFLIINILKGYFNFTQSEHAGNEYQSLIHWLCVSSKGSEILWRPWTILTHMFLHEGFWHLLWNCMALFWFGSIVEDLIGKRHAKIVFFESGILGVLFFVGSVYIFPWYKNQILYAQGSSAAVCGLLFAAATLAPNYSIRLFLFGNVSIKYIAIGVLLLDLIFASQNQNSGGHFAHIGGSFWGWAYISLLRRGIPMDIFKIESKPSTSHPTKYKSKSKIQKSTAGVEVLDSQKQLDRILEKIKKSGIENLTPEEYQFLDKMSKQ